jgi:TPP-dependent trihydroxycyclohexane-1,2-dione (THcHDO) dehydratase
MGYSMPAGMGAALGRPDKETWAIAGDGGFQMTLQELATLAQDRIPVKVALLDNKKLGMIRQWQEIIYGGNYCSDLRARTEICRGLRLPFRPPRPIMTYPCCPGVGGPALVWFEMPRSRTSSP